jgi:hypothetical protein
MVVGGVKRMHDTRWATRRKVKGCETEVELGDYIALPGAEALVWHRVTGGNTGNRIGLNPDLFMRDGAVGILRHMAGEPRFGERHPRWSRFDDRHPLWMRTEEVRARNDFGGSTVFGG